jgi:low temperature requirement protein LtrA
MRTAVSREPGTQREVDPLELFFDLVYVFAIGQLSHHLVAHVGLRTGAEVVIMALAVYYAWYMVAWGANWLDPDALAVHVAFIGLMFASLLMSVAIDDAFDGRAWLFVTGYLLLQVGRCVFLIMALRGRPQGEHFVNDLAWELLAGVLWVGGAIADGDARLALWGLAVACTYVGGLAQHWLPGRGRRVDVEHTQIAGGHLVERFRLFFIIVLGEAVLTMSTAFVREPFEFARLFALASGFAGTVALWWCYFQRAEALGAQAAETAEDAGAVGLWGTWTLTLIVLGLIAVAVSDQLAIAHPGGDAQLSVTILAFGGPTLFLLAQLLFQRATLGRAPRSRALGIGALAIVAPAAGQLTLIAAIAASTAVLVAVAIADTLQPGVPGA